MSTKRPVPLVDGQHFVVRFNQSYRSLSPFVNRKANGRMEGFVITDGKMADQASIIRFLCDMKPFLVHIGFESDGKFI